MLSKIILFIRNCDMLNIYPSSKQPVAHNEINLIVTREGRRQNDLDIRGEYNSGVDYIAILVFKSEYIVGMVGFKRECVSVTPIPLKASLLPGNV